MKTVSASFRAPASAPLRRRALVFASILAVGLLAAPAGLFAQDPLISTESSARGRREHLIRADEWGRYAVEAKSSEGVGVEVVDKLRGVIASCEADAGRNGRLDLFLEAGEYKIFTEGPRNAEGNVRLEVTKFAPFDSGGEGGRAGGKGGAFGYLAPFGQVSTRLADKEARGWWIFVPRDTLVYIEAMGRRLSSLALFRERLIASAGGDGSYSFVNGSVSGKPLHGLRIVRKLTRGKYLVMAYGGAVDKYTVSDNASPLYMQWMVRSVEPGRPISGKIGASGMSRFAAYPSDKVSHVLVESPKMQKIAVKPSYVSESDGAWQMRDFSTDTLYPKPQSGCCQAKVIEIDRGQMTVITLSGAPGAEFKITPANRRGKYSYDYTPEADGAYQISALYTTAFNDNASMSGFLVDGKDSSIVAQRVDTVSQSKSLSRTFNIVSDQWASTFVWVNEAGLYSFSPTGSAVGYQWRLKRFYVYTPQNYSPPKWERGRGSVSLSKGMYEIEIMPSGEKGNAEFSLGYGGNRGDQNAGVSPKAALGPLDLKKNRSYRFYFNAVPLELASIIVDKYPPPAKESVADVFLTGAAADKADLASAKATELAMGVTRYATLGKRESADYGFKIKEAGIYRVETTGRLHTQLTLRDRFGGLSKSQSGNGVGRNALAVEFFLPGDYLAIAETKGESAGRMGIVLSKGELRKGGSLQDGVDKRAAVKANSAVVYDFKAGKRARYRFESFGAAGSQEMRLEDSDGWPLIPHGAEAPQEVTLDKGSYKLYSLPCPYENYRVTRVDAVKEPQKLNGPGPHNIAVNAPASAVWLESGANSAARFLFEISAPIDAKISLSPDFKGALKQQGSKDAAPISVSGEYKGVLQKGKYEIAVTPITPQNHSPYELAVTTSDLIAGIGYDVYSDQTLRVPVGERGGYEIFSQGRSEVSARLYAGDKKTEIARSGGDQLDWNFFISERLDSGSYYLRLMGFNSSDDPPSKVFMRRAVDTVTAQITLGDAAAQKKSVPLSWKQVVVPIANQYGDVLNISVSSGSQIVCDLETADNPSPAKSGGARIGRKRGKRVNISAAVSKGASYTLRIWSDDRLDDAASIEIRAAEAAPISFESARNGVSGEALKDNGNTVFYKIDGMDAGPGHYELITTENEVSRASGANSAQGIFEEEEGMIVASAGRQLFLGVTFKSPEKFRFALAPVLISDAKDVSGKNEGAEKSRKNQAKSVAREEIPIVIKHGGDKAFAIDAPARTLGVITLTMPAGQPIAGLSSPAQTAAFVRNGIPVTGGQYISRGVSKAVVIPGDTGRAIGWNAQSGGSAATGVNAVFSMRNYAMEKSDTLKTGRTAWTAKQSAKEYRLPQSSPVITIKLSPRTGVAYVSPDGLRDMYYGGDDGAQYTLTPSGGRFFLFGESGGVELEMYASPAQTEKKSVAQTNVLTAGVELIKLQPVDTREALRVKNGGKQALCLFRSGSIESVDWVSKSGAMTQNVKDGGKITGESGVLLVNYGAGAGKLRLCKDDGDINACLWGEPAAAKKESLPVIREISRVSMQHGVNLYAIELSEPSHVSLSAAAAAAAMVSTDDKIGAYREFWENLRWDIPLPAGKHIVGIKPLASGSLFGTPLTVGIYPILQLTEEKPLQIQLMASQNRLAKFDLQKKSGVGIGLSTQSQAVEAALLDAKGKEIASGSQIFKELDKGAYYVLLSVPAGSIQNGVNVTVRLFGQNNPPTDPPAERIKQIIKEGQDESSTAQASR